MGRISCGLKTQNSATSWDAGSWRLRTQSTLQWGGQKHKAFLGSMRGNFSVRQQQDLTIWSVDSFTALIAKWGSRPRQVDTDVDVRMGFSFSSGLSTKQSCRRLLICRQLKLKYPETKELLPQNGRASIRYTFHDCESRSFHLPQSQPRCLLRTHHGASHILTNLMAVDHHLAGEAYYESVLHRRW